MTATRFLDGFIMKSDSRLTISYLLSHPPASTQVIRDIIEKLRQRAIDLGFLQVSELAVLTTDEAILASKFGQRPIRPEAVFSFSGALFDSDPAEFGLCKLPAEIEVGGATIPYGVPDWTWDAAIRTRDLRTLSELFSFAAENGLWTSMTFGGTTFLCYRDASGAVKQEQEWIELPDDF